MASAGAALRGYALDNEGARIAVAKHTKEIQAGSLAQYDAIVAKKMSEGATRKEANAIARSVIAEKNYTASLSEAQRKRYEQLVT